MLNEVKHVDFKHVDPLLCSEPKPEGQFQQSL